MLIRENLYDSISMDRRFPEIMAILNTTAIPLTSREVAARYVVQPSESDKLVTGSVLNILALVGLVKKYTSSDKRRTNTYVLDRSVVVVREIPA